jgi:hypothetical protein
MRSFSGQAARWELLVIFITIKYVIINLWRNEEVRGHDLDGEDRAG